MSLYIEQNHLAGKFSGLRLHNGMYKGMTQQVFEFRVLPVCCKLKKI